MSEFKEGDIYVFIPNGLGNRYEIVAVGELKSRNAVMDSMWVPCVTYKCLKSGKFYTRRISDFGEKFELENQ